MTVRFLDFIASFFLILLLSPLFLIILFFIFIQDFHNPLFIQRRVGKNLKVFNIYKFRTMKIEQGNLSSSMTQKNDPRVTIIGKILRKTSLDELAQLFNVLKGDMSLVGPRPYMEWQIEQFENQVDWVKRHNVRPGITGLAQINGRSALDQPSRTKLDFEYIDNYSTVMYIKVLFNTFAKLKKLIKSAN